MNPVVSVVIATRNRSVLLARMLPSLGRAAAGVDAEVVIVDNGSTDATAAVVAEWIGGAADRTSVSVPAPGKARALNRGLELARAPLVAFTDDDVEIPADWLRELLAFCAAHPHYAAAMGRILMPPDVTDPDLRMRVACYRTIPLFDGGNTAGDGRRLYGANMVVRRAALDRVGPFNERLGPGASGLHEDGDLARRILAAGLRIGYMPNVTVYHVVEPDRLTFEYFRDLHVRDARSRLVMEPHRGWVRPLAHLLGAACVCGWWTLLRNSRQSMRGRGQMICHGELLRLRWRHRSSPDLPPQ